MTKPGNRVFKDIPLQIVGSTKFGREPKISDEQTWNMLITDGWLAPFAGYALIQEINPEGVGRGIFSSPKLKLMFLVIDENVYKLDANLTRTKIGELNTFIGDVYIEANNYANPVILFSDSQYLYTYDTSGAGTFSQLTIDFTPGYITFQNGRFISPDRATNAWRLSTTTGAVSFPSGVGNESYVGALQTKSDNTQAAIRVPEKGNALLVFGQIVTEQWFDLPNANLFPYQRSTSSNIDYGLANEATLASGDKFIVWLGYNEKAGVTIMYSEGGSPEQISTDGINYQLARLTNPTNAYGFLYRQDGHVVYIITFPDDNITYMYDFNTKMFFNLSDTNMNHHIAKRVAFFNNKYYFVSFSDGNLYELSSDYYLGNGEEICRIRICPHIRLPDQSSFILAQIGFTIEQGQFDFDDRDTRFVLTTENGSILTTENGLYIGGGENFIDNAPRIDLMLSKDGGVAYSSAYPIFMLPYGVRQNRLVYRRLGRGNDVVPQFRFWGRNRYLATDGIASIYQ